MVASSPNARRVAVALAALVLVGALAGCVGSSGAPAPARETATPGASPLTAGSGEGNLSVHFVHVGQGASVLVVGPTGETLLYDTGDWRDGGEHVLRYLRERGVERIDYLVTSHADADHVGGHAAVIDYFETEADGVGAVYDPGVAAASRTYEAYLDAVERHDVPLYRAGAGDAVPMANATVDVLAPPEGYLADRDRNENSLALRIARGNASVLVTGDAERAGERFLRENYGRGLDADVLAAGHHGSNTSTGPGLLAASDPRAIVVQSAYDSPYDHPHREVLARLADRNVPTYWNGVHGNVVVETDGDRVAISTQRDATTAPLELKAAPGVVPGAGGPTEPRATFSAGDSGDLPPAETPTETVAADGGAGERERNGSVPLEVAEVHADAAGDDRENLNDEYVALRNGGDRPLDLSGWTVEDEADHTYAFPDGTVLGPGETLRLHTGSGRDGDGRYYWGSGSPVWNNRGDTVFVRTAEGDLVAEERYDS